MDEKRTFDIRITHGESFGPETFEELHNGLEEGETETCGPEAYAELSGGLEPGEEVETDV